MVLERDEFISHHSGGHSDLSGSHKDTLARVHKSINQRVESRVEKLWLEWLLFAAAGENVYFQDETLEEGEDCN